MTRLLKRALLAAIVAVVPVAACGGTDTASDTTASTDTLTKRQRDSIVANSGLPGATGITGAMSASDTAAARNARLDSLGKTP